MKQRMFCKIIKLFQKSVSSGKAGMVLLILTAAYLLGTAAGIAGEKLALNNKADSVYFSGSIPASAEGNWGLSFPEEGKTPVGNATFEELAKYDAFYAEQTEEKKIYLTFDVGYENGNTASILDTLKKHNVSATFFVVGTYIESEPELVKRMTEEGHIVGNHTWHHPDMSRIATMDAFKKELADVENAYQEVTGEEMTKFYRPPQGKYSEANLQMAQDLGYKTFFWSLAYVDWYDDNQPDKEEAFEKLLGRIHPGAIVLLHSTSDTNALILDELIRKWEEMGYTIRPLTELLQTDSDLPK